MPKTDSKDALAINAGAFAWNEIPGRPMWEGVTLQVVGGDQLMLSMVTMAPGASIPPHSHPHDQTGVWLEGEADFLIGDCIHRVLPGHSYMIPGNTRHSVTVVADPARALDVFAPPREDYEPFRGR